MWFDLSNYRKKVQNEYFYIKGKKNFFSNFALVKKLCN